MNKLTTENVEKVLQVIRPFLEADGGSVELVEITPENIVKVRLTGSCADCPMSIITLRAGIERALVKEMPQIRRVEAVEE